MLIEYAIDDAIEKIAKSLWVKIDIYKKRDIEDILKDLFRNEDE